MSLLALFCSLSIMFIIIEHKIKTEQMVNINLIEKAVNALNEQTGLNAAYQKDTGAKAITEGVIITIPNTGIGLFVECKKWVNRIWAATLPHPAKKIEHKTIIVSDYINPNVAKVLKEKGCYFLDAAGNAYINKPPVYIDIQGRKLSKPHKDILQIQQAGKAFQPKGMQVIFMLLTQQELVNKTFRSIADQAEVALGTVKQVIDDLSYQGFVLDKGIKNKTLVNNEKLLAKWLEAYPANIQAKQVLEIYTTSNLAMLTALELKPYKALWGGEVAGEQYTHYLTPKDLLIYVSAEHKNDLLKAGRLRKLNANEQPAHRVILAEPFLDITKLKGVKAGLVHPLLAYADLVASNEPRNIETAKRLYDEYLT
ncbi:MAG: type IV toxin-antitoxin system AbiEi family antitoxin [Cognaticolwellia sp.]